MEDGIRGHSKQQAREYVFRNGVSAPCRGRDLYALQMDDQAFDTWYLGTVPVRIVNIVGIVVGHEFWDNERNWKTTYFIDDGTCVVECTQTVDKPKHTSPQKGKVKAVSSKINSIAASSVRPSPSLVVGTLARILGSVKVWHDERHINLNKIEPLRDLNEEYKHWELVAKWYREVYSRSFEITPAVIESLPVMPVTPHRTGRKRPYEHDNGVSPGGEISRASSVAGSSPVKVDSEGVFACSDKLLHPSLIRSRDLTLKTFEIYLVYYMTIDKPPSPDGPRTAEKESRDLDRTPTQPKFALSSPFSFEREGFTINYLRNTPDLRYLARRVVLAETRRRDRDSRKREKLRETQAVASKGRDSLSSVMITASKSQSHTPSRPLSVASLTSRMKKLFETAIRSLYQAGEIIVLPKLDVQSSSPFSQSRPTKLSPEVPYPASLGPFRVWDDADPINSLHVGDSYATAKSKTRTTSRIRGSVHNESVAVIDEDPPPDRPGLDEYLPVTPELLAEPVLHAIKKTAVRSPSNPDLGTNIDRIMAFLKMNEIWARVGDWTVRETLELLVGREEIWEYSRERWKPMLK